MRLAAAVVCYFSRITGPAVEGWVDELALCKMLLVCSGRKGLQHDCSMTSFALHKLRCHPSPLSKHRMQSRTAAPLSHMLQCVSSVFVR